MPIFLEFPIHILVSLVAVKFLALVLERVVGYNCYGRFSSSEPPPLKLLLPSGLASNNGEDNTADFFQLNFDCLPKNSLIFKDFLLCLLLFCPYFVTIAYRGRGVLQANFSNLFFFFV